MLFISELTHPYLRNYPCFHPKCILTYRLDLYWKYFFWCYVMWGCKAATLKSIRVLRILDAYPGSDFFPSRILELYIFHAGSDQSISFNPQKIGSKLSEIWSGMFNPAESGFSSIPDPDPEVKKAQDPEHCGSLALHVNLYDILEFSPPYFPAKRRQNSRVQSPPVSGKEPRLRRCWLIGGRLFRHVEQDIRHCQFFQHLSVIVTEVHCKNKEEK